MIIDYILLGIWGLKKNFALLELLEKLEQEKQDEATDKLHSNDKSTFVKCDEDETHQAELYCTVCLTNLCKTCAKEIHLSKTLSLHKHVPLSEKPKLNPPCILHPSHALEFSCLEDICREDPLMCYICKDYGKHKSHKHVLIQSEADNIRKSIINAVQHTETFSSEVAEFVRKLAEITEKIEGILFCFPVIVSRV